MCSQISYSFSSASKNIKVPIVCIHKRYGSVWGHFVILIKYNYLQSWRHTAVRQEPGLGWRGHICQKRDRTSCLSAGIGHFRATKPDGRSETHRVRFLVNCASTSRKRTKGEQQITENFVPLDLTKIRTLKLIFFVILAPREAQSISIIKFGDGKSLTKLTFSHRISPRE